VWLTASGACASGVTSLFFASRSACTTRTPVAKDVSPELHHRHGLAPVEFNDRTIVIEIAIGEIAVSIHDKFEAVELAFPDNLCLFPTARCRGIQGGDL
jgi:hypothetical protein